MGWYTGNTLYDSLLIVGFVFALLLFLQSRKGTGTYGGRFNKGAKEFKLNSKLGWVLMEVPALIFFPIFFFSGSHWQQAVPLFLAAVWVFHYTNRALINPMLMRVQPGSQSSFGMSVVIGGWMILLLHSYLNGTFFSEFGTHLHSTQWFSDPRFVIGLVVYIIGFTLNVHSDYILRNLRSRNPKPDDPRYKIPYGGMFRYVSSPQYLGEITSFLGLSIMTWSLGFVFILLITIANLVPRAVLTHKWYQETFDNYPAGRKAIIPKLF